MSDEGEQREIVVVVVLGTARLRSDELKARLQEGEFVRLITPVDSPRLDMLVDGNLVAIGTPVVQGTRIAVRVVHFMNNLPPTT